MPKITKPLTPLELNKITNAGLHAVGGVPGLYVLISKTGARSWILRATVGSKRRDIGLGSLSTIGLSAARDAAREMLNDIKSGIDPVIKKQQVKESISVAQEIPTFKKAAISYIEAMQHEWKNAKHKQQWENTLEQYAYPTLENVLVSSVSTPHVVEVLKDIWVKKPETAMRLRGRIERILNYSVTMGNRESGLNPAAWSGHLANILPKQKRAQRIKHFDAMPYQDIPEFIKSLWEVDSNAARCLEFIILTVSRSQSARVALREYIDINARVLTLPSAIMKAQKEHRVPLASQIDLILERVPRMETNLIFESARGKVMSDVILTKLLRTFHPTATVHGFRSSFRDWAGEQTSYPHDVIEHALAHKIPDRTVAAYYRSDLFEKRIGLMQDWADFCFKCVKTATNSKLLTTSK